MWRRYQGRPVRVLCYRDEWRDPWTGEVDPARYRVQDGKRTYWVPAEEMDDAV